LYDILKQLTHLGDEHNTDLCPLCKRELGTENIDEHHLIPKMFKGTIKEPIHRICHRKIHATFTEHELAKKYNTWESLCEHEEIIKFIMWVTKKDIGYYDENKTSIRKKRKR